MKKMKDKITLLLTLIVMVCLACVFVGCKGCKSCKKEKGDDSSSVEAVTLNVTEKELALTNSFYLETYVGETKIDGVTYKSSNVQIVSVDAEGKVTGEKIGSADITATVAETELKCTVNVVAGEYTPNLVFNYIHSDDLVIDEASALDLSGYVTYAGKTYTDVTLSYSLSNASIGEIVENKFIPANLASNVDFAETTLTIAANWRGMTSNMLTKEISIKVVAGGEQVAYMMVNGMPYVQDITLYTLADFENESYPTEFLYDVAVYTNGTRIQDLSNLEYEVISGEGVVELDFGKVKSKKYGQAEVQLTYADAQLGTTTFHFTVNVIRPVASHAEAIVNVSALDGFTAPVSIMGTAPVTKAVQREGKTDENVLEVIDGKIYGLATINSGRTQTDVTIYNEQFGYKVNVEACTMIMDEQEDFTVFKMDAQNGFKVDGYYFVNNDIIFDESWEGVGHGSANYTQVDGFMGLLEGNGKTLYFTSKRISYMGLFGRMNATSAVQNLGVDVKNMGSNATTTNVQLSIFCYDMASGARLENLSLTYTPTTERTEKVNFVAGRINEKSILKNIYIYINDNVLDSGVERHGYLSQNLAKNIATSNTVENVHVVCSNVKEACDFIDTNSSGEIVGQYVLYACNEEVIEEGGIKIESLYRYDNVAAMRQTVTQVGSWQINVDGTATYLAV